MFPLPSLLTCISCKMVNKNETNGKSRDVYGQCQSDHESNGLYSLFIAQEDDPRYDPVLHCFISQDKTL